MDLTEEQHRIVHHHNGHAVVSAVAGSGKTTTMVERVCRLLHRGYAPGTLLVLMFNRSARESFQQKLTERLKGSGYGVPEVRTYHALGLRLTESFMRRGSLPSYKLVTDERVREKLAKQALNQAYKKENGDYAWTSKEEQEEFLTFIDLVKSSVDEAGCCFDKQCLPGDCSYFIDAFSLYEHTRHKHRIRFYEDLIREPLLAMQRDKALAEWVSDRVDHIIVDEYQDINEVQQQLLTTLAGSRAEVMVVGDVDQCIYEWRGARPEYMTERFGIDFPNPSRYTLSRTFRFGHRLSLAANHLIGCNHKRDRKLCLSASGNFDTKITRYTETDPHPVVRILTEWLQEGRRLSEAVVLVRLFGMSVVVELALLEAGIPYRLEGHSEVFERREIMALIGYLKLCSGSLAAEEPGARADYLEAMLSQPHLGIRQEEVERLSRAISGNLQRGPELIRRQIHEEMAPFLKKKLMQSAENWEWLLGRSSAKRADLLLEEIIRRLDLYEFYRKFSARQVTAENRIETCRAFVGFAGRQKLEVNGLLGKIEILKQSAKQERGDALRVTSIHRAKGLEWPLVIIPGLKDGAFPFVSTEDEKSAEDLEDERRLYYVAITRGVEQVALIHPEDAALEQSIRQGAGTHSPALRASRFLFESNLGVSDSVAGRIYTPWSEAADAIAAADIRVAGQYLQALGRTDIPMLKKAKKPQPVHHSLRTSDLASGVRVKHSFFGNGVIREILDYSQGKVRVDFDEHGEKTLLLPHAPLTLSC